MGRRVTTALERSSARARPVPRKQLAEMQTLLAAAVEESENGGGTKALAAALRKRSWIKRGFAASEACGEMIEHCPAAEKPFFEYADRLHDLVLKKMLALGDSRSRGDFRVYSQLLETLWRDEYGKKDTAGVGVAVVIVERPPREG